MIYRRKILAAKLFKLALELRNDDSRAHEGQVRNIHTTTNAKSFIRIYYISSPPLRYVRDDTPFPLTISFKEKQNHRDAFIFCTHLSCRTSLTRGLMSTQRILWIRGSKLYSSKYIIHHETPKKQDVAPSSTDDGKDEKTSKMKDATTKDAGAKPEIELSEEDLQLKTNLEVLVQRAMDSKAGVAKLALENMRTEIKTATR